MDARRTLFARSRSPSTSSESSGLSSHLLAVAVDYRNGIFAGTNDLVKKVGGTDPLDVESFVAQNRAAFDLHTA